MKKETVVQARRSGAVRVIGLPNGRDVTIKAYVAAWKRVSSLPREIELKGWDLFATSAGEILEDIRAGVHDRINRHVPAYGKGRKWADSWFFDTFRLSRIVNSPYLRVYKSQCPVELRGKLLHRFAE